MSEENKEEVGYVAFCTECKTVLPDEAAAKDVHLQAGHSGVCGLCGGVVKISREDQVNRAKDQSDYQRGLS